MMRTTPLRLMTLHLGQIGLTEARTFMNCLLWISGRRSGSRQHPRSLVRDRDRVLEVRGHRAIFGHGCPVIVEDLYVRGPGIYHGLYSDDKAGFHAFAAAGLAEIGHLRVLVHLFSRAVTDELGHDRIPS